MSAQAEPWAGTEDVLGNDGTDPAVVRFTPRVGLDAAANLAGFVALSRDRLTALVAEAEWSADMWHVSSSFVRKGKPNVSSWLQFFRHGTLEGRGAAAAGIPLDPRFGEFARAYIRYQHSVAPMVFDRLKARLDALRFIEAGFRAVSLEPDMTALSARVLTAAVGVGCFGVEAATRYQRA